MRHIIKMCRKALILQKEVVKISSFPDNGSTESHANHGSIIKKLREKKGFTQKQLCNNDDPKNYICSERTLIRIERGKIPLSEKYLNGFLSVLGVSYTEFCNEIDGEPTTTLFLNGFSDAWDLLFEKEHSKAKARMENLITSLAVDLKKPLIMQAVMLYECRESVELNGGDEGCFHVLCKALSLTSPHVVEGERNIALDRVLSGIFTLNEYRIMNIMASMKERPRNMATSVEIYKAMKKSLENKSLPNEIRNKMLPTVCYNLVDALTDQGKYKEAIKVGEFGLMHGKTVGSHRMDGLLYYSIAKAQYLMGEKDKATENFTNSYLSHKVQGRIKMVELVKKLAAEKYNVYL